MTEPTAFDAIQGPDPSLAIRYRLLRLSAWLQVARRGFDEHRSALAALLQYDDHSAYAKTLAALLKNVEKNLNYLAREFARAGAKLADEALKAAPDASPELPTSGDANP